MISPSVVIDIIAVTAALISGVVSGVVAARNRKSRVSVLVDASEDVVVMLSTQVDRLSTRLDRAEATIVELSGQNADLRDEIDALTSTTDRQASVLYRLAGRLRQLLDFLRENDLEPPGDRWDVDHLAEDVEALRVHRRG